MSVASQERTRAIRGFQRTVRRIAPSAYLHQWRILGWAGSVVYGVYSDANVWLSHGEPTAFEAWRQAAEQVSR